MISPDWCLATYAPIIHDLNLRHADSTVMRKLRLHTERYRGKRIDVVFTPFDRVDARARVLLVGITPGLQQWRLAVAAAQSTLRAGASVRKALLSASDTGGFAGSMRHNLITMLDGIGVPEALGIDSTAAMFSGRRDLIDGTSAILHAVFVDGKNYTGHSPTFDRSRILTAFVEQVLAANLAMAPKALIVPLGQAASAAVERATDVAGIDTARVLEGFPHPSGANGGRVHQFAIRRRSLRRQVRIWWSAVLD